MKSFAIRCGLLCLCVALYSHAFAQVNAVVGGTVSDASGPLIPGVEVTVKNINTGITAARVTNETGKTDIQFNSCVYIDPKNGDIYSVENDIGDTIVVFAQGTNGDVKPLRKLAVTHRAYAMAADEDKDELSIRSIRTTRELRLTEKLRLRTPIFPNFYPKRTY